MDLLFKESQNFNLILDNSQLEKFRIYMDFLLEYNSHTNLTSIVDPKEIMIKHFLDSMILSNFLQLKSNYKIVDVGTGAGFPGVPLKIINQDISLTLIDSLNKRILFLQELMKRINLNANIFHGRAEELSHKSEFREFFDVAVSRAVAPLNILCEYCLPYVKVGGYFAALKGPNVQKEIECAQNAIHILGATIEKCESLELPYDMGLRSVVILKKSKTTSKKYPRTNSKIAKNNL